MSFAELLEQEGIDDDDMEKINLLQVFYQEGYLQGVNDKNPNYDYAIKYREVVERVLELFNNTGNPVSLGALESWLDELDKYRKEYGLV